MITEINDQTSAIARKRVAVAHPPTIMADRGLGETAFLLAFGERPQKPTSMLEKGTRSHFGGVPQNQAMKRRASARGAKAEALRLPLPRVHRDQHLADRDAGRVVVPILGLV